MANRLVGLLRAAAGEISIFPSLGRWMQAVSAHLDAPADYIQSKNGSGDQAGVTADTTIAVDTDINARGITRPDAFAFQLTPGKTFGTSSRHRPMRQHRDLKRGLGDGGHLHCALGGCREPREGPVHRCHWHGHSGAERHECVDRRDQVKTS